MIDQAMTRSGPPQERSLIKKLAVIGDPISHSLSPVLQGFLISQFNLPFTYEALQVRAEELPSLITRLRRGEFAGVNVTLPHKQTIMPFLDKIVYPADRIGAVNTVHAQNGRLIGYNTDAVGFQRSLQRAQIHLRNEEVLVLGAGGAAKAVVFALIENEAAMIHLSNRSAERAEQLRARLLPHEQARVRVLAWEERESFLQSGAIQIVINTTSLGMTATRALAPCSLSRKEKVVLDLIYNPYETLFLQQARAASAATLNGLPMLIYQGVAAMELWSGKTLELEKVYSALERKMFEAYQ